MCLPDQLSTKSFYSIKESRIGQWITTLFMGTLSSKLRSYLNTDQSEVKWAVGQVWLSPVLVAYELTKNYSHACMKPFSLTHMQGCVTGSKIRPLAPWRPPLFHGGPGASSTTPFRQWHSVFPPSSGLTLGPRWGLRPSHMPYVCLQLCFTVIKLNNLGWQNWRKPSCHLNVTTCIDVLLYYCHLAYGITSVNDFTWSLFAIWEYGSSPVMSSKRTIP